MLFFILYHNYIVSSIAYYSYILHYEQFADGTVKCIEDEIPFDIPDSWEWCRFSTVTINRDSERKPVSLKDRTGTAKIYDYYGASGAIDKIDNYLFDERLLLIGEDGANLVTRSKPIAFFAEGKYWVNNHAHCIDAPDKSYLDFICLYINAINLEKYITGAAQPKMNQDNMNSIIIPIPPLKEQLLIINSVTDAYAIIDEIVSNDETLVELIAIIKSKILDLAIRGKLVPQDENDEPASVLLERIRAEKEELIKAGKIKRDKKESVIFKGEDNSYYEKVGSEVKNIDVEIPFDLPSRWVWTRLNSLFEVCSSKRVLQADWCKNGVPFYRAREVVKLSDNGFVNNELFISDEHYEKLKSEYGVPQENDLMITGVGTIGKVYIVRKNDKFYYKDASVLCFKNRTGFVNAEYAKYLMESSLLQSQIHSKTYGNTVDTITITTANEYLCALPPIPEQNRIVDTIKLLCSKLDSINSKLS